MGEPAYDIVNPRTGQRMRFMPDATGEILRIDTVNPPGAVPEPTHVHPRQVSAAHVVSGRLRFVVDGVVRDVGPGEDVTIPAGVPHRFFNPGDEDAVSIQEFRPALRSEQFFRVLFALAERGELDESGMPSLMHLAVLVPAFADEIRVTRPPWLVQRVVFALLGPVAARRGYAIPHVPLAGTRS
jgi:mannose-6-phosphate isomerase-like protein (cupin superfamily)